MIATEYRKRICKPVQSPALVSESWSGLKPSLNEESGHAVYLPAVLVHRSLCLGDLEPSNRREYRCARGRRERYHPLSAQGCFAVPMQQATALLKLNPRLLYF